MMGRMLPLLQVNQHLSTILVCDHHHDYCCMCVYCCTTGSDHVCEQDIRACETHTTADGLPAQPSGVCPSCNLPSNDIYMYTCTCTITLFSLHRTVNVMNANGIHLMVSGLTCIYTCRCMHVYMYMMYMYVC